MVEAAILAQACLRAPQALWHDLPPTTQRLLLDFMLQAREHQPFYNNHLLFAAMIEAFLFAIGQPWDRMRVDYALRAHEEWYAGDGVYRDGPELHVDYYQSFVIHPFLMTIGERLQDQREFDDWRDMVRKNFYSCPTSNRATSPQHCPRWQLRTHRSFAVLSQRRLPFAGLDELATRTAIRTGSRQRAQRCH